MVNEPVRHHYIPQFILRNFCFDTQNHVYFFSKETEKTSVQETRNVFMVNHLYRDEINTPDNPTQLEHDFAVYESEIARILKRFLEEDKITIDTEEYDKLKLFFGIMGMRAKDKNDYFTHGMSEDSKRFYAIFQKDTNFLDLWKRNLGSLVQCRSIKDVLDHPNIDHPFKVFMMRDTCSLFGMYFVVVERRETEEFILGDGYPISVMGDVPGRFPIHIYSICPLSPARALLFVSNGAKATPRNCLDFRPCVLKLPKETDALHTFSVKKLYNEEVRALNKRVFEGAKEGVIYHEKECVQLLRGC